MGGEISGSGLASLSLCDPWQKNKDRKKRAKRGKKKRGFNVLLVWEDGRRRLVSITCLIKQLNALICSTPSAQLVKPHNEHEIVLSPVRCSEVGVTRHLLKKASVSGSTTSSRVSCPPALMAATTSECVLPSTDILFTWRRQKEEKRQRETLDMNEIFKLCKTVCKPFKTWPKKVLIVAFRGCPSSFPHRSEQTSSLSGIFFFPVYYQFVCQRLQGRKSCVSTHNCTRTDLTKNPETFHYLSYICLYTFINSVSYVTVTVAL